MSNLASLRFNALTKLLASKGISIEIDNTMRVAGSFSWKTLIITLKEDEDYTTLVHEGIHVCQWLKAKEEGAEENMSLLGIKVEDSFTKEVSKALYGTSDRAFENEAISSEFCVDIEKAVFRFLGGDKNAFVGLIYKENTNVKEKAEYLGGMFGKKFPLNFDLVCHRITNDEWELTETQGARAYYTSKEGFTIEYNATSQHFGLKKGNMLLYCTKLSIADHLFTLIVVA